MGTARPVHTEAVANHTQIEAGGRSLVGEEAGVVRHTHPAPVRKDREGMILVEEDDPVVVGRKAGSLDLVLDCRIGLRTLSRLSELCWKDGGPLDVFI